MAASPWVVPNRINGIDITPSIQGTADFALIKKRGFDYVYLQCSRYSSTRELAFPKVRDLAMKAGLAVGAYHFCSHDTDPVKQMEFFHRASEGLGSKPGELPPCIDWEYCTPSKYPNHPKHCVDWLETAYGALQELFYPDNLNRVIRRYGVIYTYPHYSQQHQPHLGNQTWLGQMPLCYASYPDDWRSLPVEEHQTYHKVPKPWERALLTQYSGNKGVPVPGINGPCDRQLFNGSSGEWSDFLGLPRPVHQTVKEDK